MLTNPLEKDDVFISYSRRDGGAYAAGLAAKLTEKGKDLSCFMDKFKPEANTDLPPFVTKKIRTSKMFVLIGTNGAAESPFVSKEIQEFRKTGRPILPIDFGGAVGRASWYQLIPGLAAEPERNLESLNTGEPSTNVISFIENSFKYTTRNQRMRRWLIGGLSTFLVLTLSSVGMALFARQQFHQARTAQQLAASETEKASLATQRAIDEDRRATAATKLADQKNKEATEAAARADKKEKEAQAATILANEKTQLAREQQQIASSRQTAAQAIARLDTDPEASLKLSQTAFEIADTVEAENALTLSVFASHSRRVFGDSNHIVSLAAFDASGRYVATSGPEETCVWELDSNRKECIALRGDWGNLSFSPDRKYLSLAHKRDANLALLWEWKTNRTIDLQLENRFRNEQKECFCRRISVLSFSHDSRHIVGGGQDGILWIWETATGRLVKSWSERLTGGSTDPLDPIGEARFSKDNRFVLSADESGQVRLWEWQAPPVRTELGNQPIGSNPIALDIGSPGRYVMPIVAFGGPEERYILVARSGIGSGGGRIDAHILVIDRNNSFSRIALQGTGDMITAEFSPDGKYIVTANTDNVARVWNWQNPQASKAPALLRGHTESVQSARFSQDGEYVVTASYDNTARLWKPSTGRSRTEGAYWSYDVPSLAVLRGHSADLLDAVFSADGKSILTSAQDRTARLWETPIEKVSYASPVQSSV